MFKEIPGFNYEAAYKEMREVFDHTCIEKAIKFAADNPRLVYKKCTPEYDAVRHGFFDLYFKVPPVQRTHRKVR